MKFTPLVYILIVAIVMPPPQVFAADADKPKSYVQRLGDVIKEAAEREKELTPLVSHGLSCAPSSWVNNCGGTTPGGEIGEIGKTFKKIREKLNEVLPEAQKLDAQISPDKIAATTACQGGTGALAAYQDESKKAAEKIRPVLADAVAKVQAMRKKYNTHSDGFIPMVRRCGGMMMSLASDSDLPQFPGEGFVMLYKPVSGTSPSCDPQAANAAKFFVDPKLRRSANPGVQRLYGMAGSGSSGLQDFESIASTTLKELEGRIFDLAKASQQNKAHNATDCAPAPAAAVVGGDPKKGKPDVSGTEKPSGDKPAAVSGEAKPAAGAKPSTEAEAVARSAPGQVGSLDKAAKPLPEVGPERKSPATGGTKAAADIFDDNSFDDKDVVWDKSSEKTLAGPEVSRASTAQTTSGSSTGAATPAKADASDDTVLNSVDDKDIAWDPKSEKTLTPELEKPSAPKVAAAESEKPAGAKPSTEGQSSAPAPETSSTNVDREGKPVRTVAQSTRETEEADRKRVADEKAERERQDALAREAVTQKENERQRKEQAAKDAVDKQVADAVAAEKAKTQAAEAEKQRLEAENARLAGNQKDTPGATTGGADQRPPASTDSGGISATGALVGVAALGAIGGGIYMATKGKKKSSGGGAMLPPPAPAATATQTSVATETAVSTATATSTATSTSTNTQASGGVVIDLGPLSGQSSATQTLTNTSTSISTATATSGENFGRDGAGGIGGVNKGNRKVTGSSLFRPAPLKPKRNATGSSMFRPSAQP